MTSEIWRVPARPRLPQHTHTLTHMPRAADSIDSQLHTYANANGGEQGPVGAWQLITNWVEGGTNDNCGGAGGYMEGKWGGIKVGRNVWGVAARSLVGFTTPTHYGNIRSHWHLNNNCLSAETTNNCSTQHAFFAPASSSAALNNGMCVKEPLIHPDASDSLCCLMEWIVHGDNDTLVKYRMIGFTDWTARS